MVQKLNSAFEYLDRRITDMLSAYGISSPTGAQEKMIPAVLEGKNVLLLSPTGSGKTEAAILPIFQKILEGEPTPISTLYITPLRALNRDMLGRLIEYGKELGIRTQVRHSDVSNADRRKIVTHPADILITTPESLQILLNGKRLREIIRNVKYVVVDELHEAAQNERGSQFAIALERLRGLAGNFQRIGLSATVGNSVELSKFLSPGDPVEIIKSEIEKKLDVNLIIPPGSTEQEAEVMGCDQAYAGAITYIWSLIQQHQGTLVFVNTRSVAEDIAFRLRLWLDNPSIQVHHGSLSKSSRETAEQEFKAGKIKALICTSSLELGIDIGTADLVIQFNSARQINKLIQRIGRSGHWIEKVSKGYIICSDIIELEEAMAIVSHIKGGHLEDIMIRQNSLATVANQIINELHFTGKERMDDIYGAVTRAYPFRNLPREDFDTLMEFLASTNKVWIQDDIVGKKRGSLRYYIENISMIPNEKNYRVIDTINKKFIGTLDERYVINEIEPGTYFVMKGMTWRTIRLDEEKILVEPFSTAAIAPKWSGEEIPVLPDVTGMVSHNRKNRIVINEVAEVSRSSILEWYEKEPATLDQVVIESYGSETIIQILLGTRANFALAEILSSLVASMTGESVEMDYSPYHIYLRSSRKIKAADMKNIVLGVRPEMIESYIRGMARRSRFFSSVFLYEAKKFGIISNDADMGRIRFEKIVDAYHDTPVYNDSIRKLMSDYMDIEGLYNYLGKLGNEVEFILRDGMSESSRIFLSHYSERVSPLKPTKTILDSVYKRIQNEEVTLYCTSCRNVRTQKIRDIPGIKCPNCGSYLVASLSPFERELLRTVEGDSKEAVKTRRRLIKNAHLVRERGMRAIMVMAARGIGPETGSRLLEVSYTSDEEFVRAILNAEMDFARNRRFWD